jgi:hypothetical protein
MPGMHAALPGLFVEYFLLVGDIDAIDVFEVDFFLAHDELG